MFDFKLGISRTALENQQFEMVLVGTEYYYVISKTSLIDSMSDTDFLPKLIKTETQTILSLEQVGLERIKLGNRKIQTLSLATHFHTSTPKKLFATQSLETHFDLFQFDGTTYSPIVGMTYRYDAIETIEMCVMCKVDSLILVLDTMTNDDINLFTITFDIIYNRLSGYVYNNKPIKYIGNDFATINGMSHNVFVFEQVKYADYFLSPTSLTDYFSLYFGYIVSGNSTFRKYNLYEDMLKQCTQLIETNLTQISQTDLDKLQLVRTHLRDEVEIFNTLTIEQKIIKTNSVLPMMLEKTTNSFFPSNTSSVSHLITICSTMFNNQIDEENLHSDDTIQTHFAMDISKENPNNVAFDNSAILNSISNIVFVALGEYFMFTDFGVPLDTMIFKTSKSINFDRMKTYITQQVLKFERHRIVFGVDMLDIKQDVNDTSRITIALKCLIRQNKTPLFLEQTFSI